MGCTACTSYSMKNRVIHIEKNLPTVLSVLELSSFGTQKKASGLISTKTQPQSEALYSKITEKPLKAKDIRFISEFLHSHFLFKEVEEEVRSFIIKTMINFKFEANEVVFKQGDYGDYMFIIAKGHVEVMVNGKNAGIVSKGGIIGEIALMHNTTRTATVVTQEAVEL